MRGASPGRDGPRHPPHLPHKDVTMRGCGTLAAARAAFVALACGSTWAPGVALSSTKHAAPSPKLPFAYNTSGAVGIGAAPGSVSGPAVLQFQGLSGATFDPRSGR